MFFFCCTNVTRQSLRLLKLYRPNTSISKHQAKMFLEVCMSYPPCFLGGLMSVPALLKDLVSGWGAPLRVNLMISSLLNHTENIVYADAELSVLMIGDPQFVPEQLEWGILRSDKESPYSSKVRCENLHLLSPKLSTDKCFSNMHSRGHFLWKVYESAHDPALLP